MVNFFIILFAFRGHRENKLNACFNMVGTNV
jgi:hypothetical protein